MRPWLEERADQSVWVGGTNGIGKTHTLMYVAYRMIIEQALPCRAIRCSSWLRNQSTLRAGDRSARAEASADFLRVARSRLLIMDDLGKEKLTESKAEILYDLIDMRDRDSRPVWISTNKPGSVLLKRLNGHGDHDHGDAIITRLKRMIPKSNMFAGGGAENAE